MIILKKIPALSQRVSKRGYRTGFFSHPFWNSRSQWVDFSTPYFYSGVSMMVAPKRKTNVPLLAFLLPLSPSLWIAIFVSLHVTTVAVALYEWFSPFGLNPSGRQRSKNFG